MGAPRRLHPGQGQARLRPEGRRVPEVLVADGDEHRRAEVLPRASMGSPERERSVKQMIGRVVDTIGGWGRAGGYFADDEEADTFEAELKAILVNQYASFNSPVWFNVGFEEKPQCSACFILSIDDSMESILDWIRREGVIFRGGSGSGVNLSRLRSSKEQLSKGGYASGPVSFMRGADASAGHDQVGRQDAARGEDGRPRRRPPGRRGVHLVQGARGGEGARPRAGRATTCRSTRRTGRRSSTRTPTTRCASPTPSWRRPRRARSGTSPRAPTARVVETVDARDLLRQIAEAAWQCADPGVQYDTTINSWHTRPNSGRINASNPCSEYMSPRRLGLQPRLAQPDEVPPRGRRARRRGVPARRRRRLPRTGDRRRLLVVPDARDRGEREGLPRARPRLREPRRAADGARAARTTPTKAARTRRRSPR